MIDPKLFLEAGLQLHGHRCPAMPMGLRAGAIAMNTLGVERSGDKTLLALVELGDHHCAHCFADGVQTITGCTFGKGNIRKLGYGKFGLTLVDQTTGRAVRVVPRADAQIRQKKTPFFLEYRMKGVPPTQVPEEVVNPLIERVLNAPQEEIFRIGEVFDYEVNEVKDEFDSAVCDGCGDMVVESYLESVDGQRLCVPCREKRAGASQG